MAKDLDDPTNVDSVPALLTPGEFVLNKEASQHYAPMIEQMNNHGLQIREEGNRQHLNRGGNAGSFNEAGGLWGVLNDWAVPEMHNMGGVIPQYPDAISSAAYNTGGFVDFLKKHEGYRDEAYQDQGGTWTIGYGRTRNADGSKIAKGQATDQESENSWLNTRAAADRNATQAYLKDKGYENVTPNQVDALASFRYNIGNLDQLTANGTRGLGEIEQAIPLYNKAGGEVSEGLNNRRGAEVDLFNSHLSPKASNVSNVSSVVEKTAPTFTETLTSTATGAVPQLLAQSLQGRPPPQVQMAQRSTHAPEYIPSVAAQPQRGDDMNRYRNNGGPINLNTGGWFSNWWNGDGEEKVDQNAGYADYSQQDFVNEANRANSAAANSGYTIPPGYTQGPAQFTSSPVTGYGSSYAPRTYPQNPGQLQAPGRLGVPQGPGTVPMVPEPYTPPPNSDESLLQGSSASIEAADPRNLGGASGYGQQGVAPIPYAPQPENLPNWGQTGPGVEEFGAGNSFTNGSQNLNQVGQPIINTPEAYRDPRNLGSAEGYGQQGVSHLDPRQLGGAQGYGQTGVASVPYVAQPENLPGWGQTGPGVEEFGQGNIFTNGAVPPVIGDPRGLGGAEGYGQYGVPPVSAYSTIPTEQILAMANNGDDAAVKEFMLRQDAQNESNVAAGTVSPGLPTGNFDQRNLGGSEGYGQQGRSTTQGIPLDYTSQGEIPYIGGQDFGQVGEGIPAGFTDQGGSPAGSLYAPVGEGIPGEFTSQGGSPIPPIPQEDIPLDANPLTAFGGEGDAVEFGNFIQSEEQAESIIKNTNAPKAQREAAQAFNRKANRDRHAEAAQARADDVAVRIQEAQAAGEPVNPRDVQLHQFEQEKANRLKSEAAAKQVEDDARVAAQQAESEAESERLQTYEPVASKPDQDDRGNAIIGTDSGSGLRLTEDGKVIDGSGAVVGTPADALAGAAPVGSNTGTGLTIGSDGAIVDSSGQVIKTPDAVIGENFTPEQQTSFVEGLKSGWGKAFSDLFGGDLEGALKKGLILAAGAMITGASPASALAYAGKAMLAQGEERRQDVKSYKADILANPDKYNKDSVKNFRASGNINDLKPAAGAVPYSPYLSKPGTLADGTLDQQVPQVVEYADGISVNQASTQGLVRGATAPKTYRDSITGRDISFSTYKDPASGQNYMIGNVDGRNVHFDEIQGILSQNGGTLRPTTAADFKQATGATAADIRQAADTFKANFSSALSVNKNDDAFYSVTPELAADEAFGLMTELGYDPTNAKQVSQWNRLTDGAYRDYLKQQSLNPQEDYAETFPQFLNQRMLAIPAAEIQGVKKLLGNDRVTNHEVFTDIKSDLSAMRDAGALEGVPTQAGIKQILEAYKGGWTGLSDTDRKSFEDQAASGGHGFGSQNQTGFSLFILTAQP